MKIDGENGKEYEGRFENGKAFVDTTNRKAFVMNKMYHVLDGQFKNSCLMCKTTHQKEGKSCFGGFGFDVVTLNFVNKI